MEDGDLTLSQNILKQVEYYFSKQNLQHDHYLVSKMNPQMFVPLEIVAKFKMLRNLTTDLDLIRKSLASSKNVQIQEVDGQWMIRPMAAAAVRTTIILRDIPNDVAEESVRKIFGEQAEKIVTMKPEIGDTWFITFSNEDDCQKAYEASQANEYDGREVKARIKSENLLHNFLPAGQTPGQSPPKGMGPNASQFDTAPKQPYGQQMGMPYLPNGMANPMVFNPLLNPMLNPAMLQNMMQLGGPMAMGGGGGAGAMPFGALGSTPSFPLNMGTSTTSGLASMLPNLDVSSPQRANLATQNFMQQPSLSPSKQPMPRKVGPQDFPTLPTNLLDTGGYENPFSQFSPEQILDILAELQTMNVSAPLDIPPEVRLPQPIHTMETKRPHRGGGGGGRGGGRGRGYRGRGRS
eukprot:NODE_2338_length_1445_cov_86.557489_g2221_i0.p1 GENE.NODE_2338_length_1445_cov_86.557489_g2221_i0~~NODE_2338_length_1445_cov_86.557489_g2221_i0.p1  ORF type:complete len:439 (-),score=83.89 NODE_2338_length_1445_cov_86.557489_g2221_i0:129-1346(-)